MCIVGASLGGAIVLMFALKYPSYVSMICLLAPPGKYNKQIYHINTILQLFFINILANEQCETELTQQIRLGTYKALLPETPEELYAMINMMTVKKINAPQLFINGFLHLRLRLIQEHKKGNINHYNIQGNNVLFYFIIVLSSLLEYDYPNLENHYQQLKNLTNPILILWGRQDRVFSKKFYFQNNV